MVSSRLYLKDTVYIDHQDLTIILPWLNNFRHVVWPQGSGYLYEAALWPLCTLRMHSALTLTEQGVCSPYVPAPWGSCSHHMGMYICLSTICTPGMYICLSTICTPMA
jgi:hypothetical protein